MRFWNRRPLIWIKSALRYIIYHFSEPSPYEFPDDTSEFDNYVETDYVDWDLENPEA